MAAMSEFRPTKRALVALGLGLAGFVVSVGDSGSTLRNGVVTDAYEYNYAAVALGALAIAVALAEGVRLVRAGAGAVAGPLAGHLALLGGVVLLGFYQLLSGSDIV